MISDDMAFISSSHNNNNNNHFIFQPHHHHHHHQEADDLPPSSLLPHCSSQDFHAQMRRSMSFSGAGTKCDQEMMMNGGDDDMSDDGSPLGEKKRRLSIDQVRGLEKSFELGNKLEPERKVQLARALGLQPRQVAIWFQNRRARWKTKQLERDYEVLKRKFEALKGENEGVKAHNKKLQDELMSLKGIESKGYEPINLNNKETDQNSWSNGTDDTSCDVNLATHLLRAASRPDGLEFRKIDQTVHDEGYCNVFTGIADHQGFWQWSEQQHYQN